MAARLWLVALVALALLLPRAAAAQVPRVHLSVEVPSGLDLIRGTLRTTVLNNTSEPLSELLIWLPFNRLERPPEGMDQRNVHWIYPRHFAPGRIEVDALRWRGRRQDVSTLRFDPRPGTALGEDQRILATVPLAAPLPPGETGLLEIEFETTVPRRFGRLGRARGVLTLAGGFYPQVAALEPSGWRLDGPSVDQDWTVELRAPAGSRVIVNERAFVIDEMGRRGPLELERAPYVALIVARRYHRTELDVDGVHVELLTRAPRRAPIPNEVGFRDPNAPRDANDAMRWDWAGRTITTARRALRVLEELGLPLPPGSTLRFVEVPLRLELLSPIPGAVLISDRAYRVTPLEQFFRFHDLQVARAVGWVAVERFLDREAPADRGWVRDLYAAAVADAFALSAHGGRGPGLRRLLRIGAFIPDIDNLLYSPVIEFRHLFLRPFRDEDPLRDEPWRLATTWPRGAVLHDKLVDLLGADTVGALLRETPRAVEPLRARVSRAAEEDMGWFFDQWLGPYPEVNYRVAERSSERTAGGWRHRVVVERQGADIREPVEVRFQLAGGHHEDLRWDGRGSRGVLVLDSEDALRRVVIDPRRRLLEDAGVAGDNPLFDNVSPPQWRTPVLNGLLLYLSAAESELYALIDFSLRRRFDVRHGVRLRLEYDPRGVRGDLFYQRGLGRLLDLNRASWVLSAGVNVLRTIGNFASSGVDATAFGAQVSLSHDTRWYPYDPMHGWGLSVGLRGGGSVTDEGDWGWSVGASGRVAGHLTPRVGHTFTIWGGAGIVLGEPLAEQLQSISDRDMLRAFEADETLGRARLYAGVEYRWTALTDLDVNLFNLAWWRTLFLVVFAAGGTVSRPDGYGGLFSAERIFTEVGVGLRTLLELAGVQPYIIAVDVAYPITPRDRQRCGQTECVPRAPVGVYVSIQHTM